MGPEHRLNLSLQPERVHLRAPKRGRSSSERVEPRGLSTAWGQQQQKKNVRAHDSDVKWRRAKANF